MEQQHYFCRNGRFNQRYSYGYSRRYYHNYLFRWRLYGNKNCNRGRYAFCQRRVNGHNMFGHLYGHFSYRWHHLYLVAIHRAVCLYRGQRHRIANNNYNLYRYRNNERLQQHCFQNGFCKHHAIC